MMLGEALPHLPHLTPRFCLFLGVWFDPKQYSKDDANACTGRFGVIRMICFHQMSDFSVCFTKTFLQMKTNIFSIPLEQPLGRE